VGVEATTRLGATAKLAATARALTFDELPDDVVAVAKHCLLDWLGVTLAGSREPLAEILGDELVSGSADGEATLVGRAERSTAHVAALVNGAAGHALDFDDTHLGMMGHPTAPVAPAVLALGERLDSSGAAALTALVAGIELECKLGALIGPSHYATGFHATATLGTFGAAAGAAHLLELDEERWLHALGIAGTQAAGLKAVFGTMCKPLHAGKAAANGLLAATLAQRGFTSDEAILEAHQGFGSTHSTELGELPELDAFEIRRTLFKYHAACYLTHAAVEAALALDVAPDDIEEAEVRVDPGVLDVAGIEEPRTGLEGKFSLRATIALAFLGDDTTDPATYTDSRMTDADLVALRDRVHVVAVDSVRRATASLRVRTRGGLELQTEHDSTTPEDDLDRQHRRLVAKFNGLALPLLGAERTQSVVDAVDRLDELASIRELTRLCAA
jgi:2-methylcitrate dehydratase PrpD